MVPLLHTRLEEKFSDMEAENQYIRSKSLTVSSSMKKSPLGAPVNIKTLFIK